jgi:hypothetical protein
MILSQIGEARPAAGVIRKAKSPRLGFSQPYEISYRGVKLPRISAALGRCYLRHGSDLPQGGPRPPTMGGSTVQFERLTVECGWYGLATGAE